MELGEGVSQGHGSLVGRCAEWGKAEDQGCEQVSLEAPVVLGARGEQAAGAPWAARPSLHPSNGRQMPEDGHLDRVGWGGQDPSHHPP